MPSINEVLERVNRARPDALDDKTKAAWLIELDGKLYREVILRHRLTSGRCLHGPIAVCPACESTDGLTWDRMMDSNRCAACGWTDLPKIVQQFPEDGDEPLLVEAPYDNLYDLYVMAQVDFYNREADNYNNSALAFNTALDEYKKDYHRNHAPIGAGGVTKLF
jgi:Zn ribbon nucleic-acid-binding protein